MITKIKPCKYCQKTNHYSFQCSQNPHRKKITSKNVQVVKWIKTRKVWFMNNPQDYYNCHYCGKLLAKNEVELDHYISRSRRPDLKYELSNIVPSCHFCNTLKGSLSGDEFKARKVA